MDVQAQIKCNPSRWARQNERAVFDHISEIGGYIFDNHRTEVNVLLDGDNYRPIRVYDTGFSRVCEVDFESVFTPLPGQSFNTWGNPGIVP